MPPLAVLDGVDMVGIDQDDKMSSDEHRRKGEGETRDNS
jgi:hypothetical protein